MKTKFSFLVTMLLLWSFTGWGQNVYSPGLGKYLLTTKWNQEYPYNQLIRDSNSVISSKILFIYPSMGCITAATAQVMYYYAMTANNYGLQKFQTSIPANIPGYISERNGWMVPLIQKGTFDWNLMLLYYDWGDNGTDPLTNRNAIAKFYTALVSSGKTDFNSSTDGGTNAVIDENFFGFKEMSTDTSNLQNLLNQGRPVYCMLQGGGGHAVIIDGYYKTSSKTYYHMNFGWGGKDDGYYDITTQQIKKFFNSVGTPDTTQEQSSIYSSLSVSYYIPIPNLEYPAVSKPINLNYDQSGRNLTWTDTSTDNKYNYYKIQYRVKGTLTWIDLYYTKQTTFNIGLDLNSNAYEFQVAEFNYITTSTWSDPYTIDLKACPDNTEPNNNSLQTAPTLSDYVSASIATSNDIDYYKFVLDNTYSTSIDFSTGTKKYNIQILNSTGNPISLTDNQIEEVSMGNILIKRINLALGQGTYYVKVSGNSSSDFSAAICYSISFKKQSGCDPYGNYPFHYSLYVEKSGNYVIGKVEWDDIPGVNNYTIRILDWWIGQKELRIDSIKGNSYNFSLDLTKHETTIRVYQQGCGSFLLCTGGLLVDKTYKYRIDDSDTGISNFSATSNSNKTVTLKWNQNVNPYLQYEIQYKKTSAFDWNSLTIQTVVNGNNSYATPVLSDGTYVFRIRQIKIQNNQYNAYSFSSTFYWAYNWINTGTVTVGNPPTPPTNLVGGYNNAGAGKIYLSWTKSTDTNITGYVIYKNNQPLDSVAGTANTYETSSGLTIGQTYNFTVRAKNSSNAYSDATASLPIILPPAPKIIGKSSNYVILQWTPVPNVIEYSINNQIFDKSKTTDTIKGLSPMTTYRFYVAAKVAGGYIDSQYSDQFTTDFFDLSWFQQLLDLFKKLDLSWMNNFKSANSLSKTATSDITAGDTFTYLAGGAQGAKVMFDWNRINNATGYQLDYRKIGASEWTTVTVPAIAASGNLYEQVVTTDVPSASYAIEWKITAKGDAVDITSGAGENISVLNTPFNLRHTVSGNNAVLSWDAVPQASGYMIEYGASETDLQKLFSAADSITMSDLKERTYMWRVTAMYMNAGGGSISSATMSDPSEFKQNLVVGSMTDISDIAAGQMILYPNPVHDILTVDGLDNTGETVNAIVYDMTGSVVKTVSVKAEGAIRINVSDLPKNSYILSIEGEKLRFIKN